MLIIGRDSRPKSLNHICYRQSWAFICSPSKEFSSKCRVHSMVPYTSNMVHFYHVSYVLLARSMTLVAKQVWSAFWRICKKDFFFVHCLLNLFPQCAIYDFGVSFWYRFLWFLALDSFNDCMYDHSALLNTECELVAHMRESCRFIDLFLVLLASVFLYSIAFSTVGY